MRAARDSDQQLGKTNTSNMSWRAFEPTAPGILLCGDAAGIIDPASGQGVYAAILSGIKAAQAVTASTSEPGKKKLFFESYNNWFAEYFQARCQELKGYYKELGVKV